MYVAASAPSASFVGPFGPTMARIAQIAAVFCQPTISPHIKVDENKQIAHRRMVAGPGIRGIIAK